MNAPTPAADTWTLHFRAVGPGPDAAIRVRRLLKAALRAYGLRCTAIGSPADRADSCGRETEERAR